MTQPPAPAIVLVRPQLGENIGKAARAMLNFGMTDMRLVAPRDGWPNPSAGPAASGADIVLEKARLFDTVDLIAAPAMVVPTPRLDGLDALLGAPGALEKLIRFTAPFDHSGNPTLSLPCGFTEAGLPLGFQLIGRHLGEALLLRAGHAFEKATVWNARHPDV